MPLPLLLEADIDTAATTKLIALKAQGKSDLETAKQIGCSRLTVWRNRHGNDAIKALIEREAAEIMNRGLKPARKTLTRLAAMGNSKGADKDHLKLALDASKHITSMAGLSGTTPSTIINNLMLINQAPEQAQELSGIQAFLSHSWTQSETVDAEDCSKIDTPTITDTTEQAEGQGTGIATAHTRPPGSATGSATSTPEGGEPGQAGDAQDDSQDAPDRATNGANRVKQADNVPIGGRGKTASG